LQINKSPLPWRERVRVREHLRWTIVTVWLGSLTGWGIKRAEISLELLEASNQAHR